MRTGQSFELPRIQRNEANGHCPEKGCRIIAKTLDYNMGTIVIKYSNIVDI